MKTCETTNVPSRFESTYLLDNAAPQVPARFDALSELFDRQTKQHLERCGVGPGWSCLEVGGGGGSIATWLAARVGHTGHVVVTDLDPRFLDASGFQNMKICRHNIVTDPLPEAAFDLIHARLVLIHIPEREKVLERLVKALKPGGWIVDEEFDSESLRCDRQQLPGEVQLKTQEAIFRLLDERGVDRRWGRRVHEHMRAVGLVDIRAEGRLSMWQGGSTGASLTGVNFEQLHDALISHGYVTAKELTEDKATLEDPDFTMPSPIMWTTWGRRPAEQE